jgi:amino acid adenylation domain-containing protein/non-ribosomal peptide synthase protein (TIGR01720 family)
MKNEDNYFDEIELYTDYYKTSENKNELSYKLFSLDSENSISIKHNADTILLAILCIFLKNYSQKVRFKLKTYHKEKITDIPVDFNVIKSNKQLLNFIKHILENTVYDKNIDVGLNEHIEICYVVDGYTKFSSQYKYDLVLCNEPTSSNTHKATLYYNKALFNELTIDYFIKYLINIYSQITAINEISINNIKLFGEAELQKTVYDWNNTEKNFSSQNYSLHKFTEQTKLSPHSVALIFENKTLTYLDLDNRTNQLGRYLQTIGVGPDTIVGVYAERSIEMVISIFSIIKAGGAYLPLEPTYPSDRLNYMVELSHTKIILTHKGLLSEKSFNCKIIDLNNDQNDIAAFSSKSILNSLSLDNLAYVIFTSGSTGTPKGVMISHRSIINRIEWMDSEYKLNNNDRVLQKTPFSFDVSVWEFFWTLRCGGTLVLAKPDGHKDSNYIADLISKEKITIIHFVPSMLRIFLETANIKEHCQSLRHIFVSGEAISSELADDLDKKLHIPLHNLYGPTETCVDVTYWLSNTKKHYRSVPIGYPISNTKAYILNGEMQLMPIGAIGELYIGGIGLARGYIGKPDITADKFVPNPIDHIPGERLYKTGDLARYRSDGAIEFMGRNDNQIKLRGFRIELQEIEKALQKHPNVKAAVVLLHRQLSHHDQLIAYVVLETWNIYKTEISNYLKKLLPEYMLPTKIIAITEIPTTSNGKQDTKKLISYLEYKIALTNTNSNSASNSIEKKLVDIWRDILKVKSINIKDHFFELGGDSILMMEVVIKARAIGLYFTFSQFYANPTIQQLSKILKTESNIKNLKNSENKYIPFTPIQKWFLQQKSPNPEHFNQAILLALKIKLSKDELKLIFDKITAHHDILKLKLIYKNKKWQQFIKNKNNYSIDYYNLINLNDDKIQNQISVICEALQKSLYITTGPLFRVAYFETNNNKKNDYLFITSHHFLIDGVSWRIILQDITSSYIQLNAGEKIALPENTTEFLEWSTLLHNYAHAKTPISELTYWQKVIGKTNKLSIDKEGSNLVKFIEHENIILSKSETNIILNEGQQLLRAQANDILLTCLSRALSEWLGEVTICIDVEGHGREENILESNIDLSRTVGWFTSIYPVSLQCKKRIDLELLLNEVKDNLKIIPNKGIGYGILSYLDNDPYKLEFLDKREICFNYLGKLDSIAKTEAKHLFSIEQIQFHNGYFLAKGNNDNWLSTPYSPNALRQYLVEINSIILNDKLHIQISYSQDIFKAKTIKLFKNCYTSAIKEFIQLIQSKKKIIEKTAFPITERLIEKSGYLLSPTQSGILFHALSSNKAEYIQQFTCEFIGNLNKELFAQIWEYLVNKYDVLKTSINIESNEGKPLQYVQNKINFKVEILNWTEYTPCEQKIKFNEFLKSDSSSSFDLSSAPLMRIRLIQFNNSVWKMVWTHHHIMLDGWSVAILLDEMIELYSKGLIPSLNRNNHSFIYREFIDWVNKNKSKEYNSYWRQLLDNITKPTLIPYNLNNKDIILDEFYEKTFIIPFDIRVNLEKFASKNQITLSTLIHSCWGLLLGVFTRKNKVIFGTAVSGRPISILNGVESAIGMFINTLPIVVELKPQTNITAWLQTIHAQILYLLENQNTSLMGIQLCSKIPPGNPLFNNILIYESHPIQERYKRMSDVSINAAQMIERTNYPLSITISPNEDIEIIFQVAPQTYSEKQCETFGEFFLTILKKITNPNIEYISDLYEDLNSDFTTAKYIPNFFFPEENITYDLNNNIILLFKEQVRNKPSNLAIRHESQTLTYIELDKYSDNLAFYLRSKNEQNNSPVAICIERSVEQIISVLTVLKAGLAFVPLEPSLPNDRLNYILKETSPAIILTTSNIKTKITYAEINSNIILLDNFDFKHNHSQSQDISNITISPTDLAYIIFTSGSTGSPKGVMVEHHSLFNAYKGWEKIYRLDHDVKNHLQMASFSFDVFIGDFVRALCSGGTLTLCPRNYLLEPALLYNVINENKIECAEFVPAVLRILADYMEIQNYKFNNIKILICGSDNWSKNDYFRFKKLCSPSTRLINSYGITECTIDSLYYDDELFSFDPLEDSPLPIGKPFPNVQAYILDELLNPVSENMIGELYIGGMGLAREYLNQPELTAEKFIYYKFKNNAEKVRLYKTGDLARYRADGNIEFVGRNDSQIKIRGFRIELNEIENSINQIQGVQQSAVISSNDKLGSIKLIAYIVLNENLENHSSISTYKINPRILRSRLMEKLPDYMIPQKFIILSQLPLNLSGKIDRNALAKLKISESPEKIAKPRNSIEELVFQTWCDIFNNTNIGIDDNFFEVGGHSLLATRICLRIKQKLNLDITPKEIFESLTIRALSILIMSKLNKNEKIFQLPSIDHVDRNIPLRLSFAQQRLWFLDQWQKNDSFYNMFEVWKLKGKLNKAALTRSFKALLERHEILRTAFTENAGIPIQIIKSMTEIEFKISEVNFSKFDSIQREEMINKNIYEEMHMPFDLSSSPLIRVTLISCSPNEFYLILIIHHIICDGWSIGILTRDLSEFYKNEILGDAENNLPSLEIQYADYAVWQRKFLHGHGLHNHIAYWKHNLENLPVLNLPTDYIRLTVASYDGAACMMTIPHDLVKKLKELGKDESATLYMLLLSAFLILLFRYTNQEDIVIGSPIANRMHNDLENLIGFFVNSLVIRNDLSDDPTIKELIERVKQTTLRAYAHQDMPFEQLVEILQPDRDQQKNPLFQVIFALQNTPYEDFSLHKIHVERIEQFIQKIRFDMEWYFEEKGNEIIATCYYATSLFAEETIKQMLNYYKIILYNITDNIDATISSIILKKISVEQSNYNEMFINNSNFQETSLESLCSIFQKHVSSNPNAVAIYQEEKKYTYSYLDEESNKLAHKIINIGVHPEEAIGFYFEQSVEIIVSMLGIIKAGCAYVPLDINQPEDRTIDIVSNANIKVIITISNYENRLKLDKNISFIYIDKQENKKRVTSPLPSLKIYPENITYIMYTSGSTGQPKGVSITHQAIIRLVTNTNYIKISPTDRIAQTASIAFDAATFEIWGALLNGASIVFISKHIILDKISFKDSINKYQVNIMWLTSGLFNYIIENYDLDSFRNFSYLLVGGDIVNPGTVNKLLESGNSPQKIINGYGPTENTTFTTTYLIQDITENQKTIPIGNPITQTYIYVFDDNFNHVPIDIPGELYIGGKGLARCYLNDAALTADKFIPDPLGNGARLYKTGDIVKWNKDKKLEFIGRKDNQVKIRGFRVELEEINHLIRKYPAVKDSVVITKQKGNNNYIYAYILLNTDEAIHLNNHLENTQVEQWSKVFDEYIYQNNNDSKDEAFNITGWISTYTKKPLSQEVMKQWLNYRINLIKRIAPKNIIEIGCGTGLILFQLAEYCNNYYGCDISEKSLSYIKHNLPSKLDKVNIKLESKAAHEIHNANCSMSDMVIINSVVQYFPSITYLIEVIESAMEKISIGGKIFIGDIRNYKLNELFHTSVSYFQLNNSDITIENFIKHVDKRATEDNELSIDPIFFTLLKKRYPRISHVTISLQHGKDHNELTRFRYDVLLHLDNPITSNNDNIRILDWHDDKLSFEKLSDYLNDKESKFPLLINNVPNSRIIDEMKIIDAIKKLKNDQLISSLESFIKEENYNKRIDPEDVFHLAEKFDFEAIASWSKRPYEMDIVFLNDRVYPFEFPCKDPQLNKEEITYSKYASIPLHVKQNKIISEELTSYLKKNLPDYMIPSGLFILEKFPLTRNGKIDKQALPYETSDSNIETHISDDHIANMLIEIWVTVLGSKKIDIKKSFFEMGGHSLLATQVVSRIRSIINAEITLKEFFGNSSINQLAKLIKQKTLEKKRVKQLPLVKVKRSNQHTLSFSQSRLWFLEQLYPDNNAYHISDAYTLLGQLNFNALQNSINLLIKRHESLRTFFYVDEGVPYQAIIDQNDIKYEIPVFYFDTLKTSLNSVNDLIKNIVNEKFNLQKAPLMRAAIIRLSSHQSILVICFHHIVCDGWSMKILLEDLNKYYCEFNKDRIPILELLPYQYIDYAAWQNEWLKGKIKNNLLDFWKEQLSEVKPLQLMIDKDRPITQTFNGNVIEFSIPPQVTEHLHKIAIKEEVTLYMLLLAAFKVLLYQYSNQDDITVGSPIANREHQDLESIVGFFVNTIVIRSKFDSKTQLREFLNQIKNYTLNAYMHQDLPFEQLVENLMHERIPNRTPLFQVMFALQNTPKAILHLDTLKLEHQEINDNTSKFDLNLNIEMKDNYLACYLEYNTDLYYQTTIERMSKHYLNILDAFINNSQQKIADISILSETENKIIEINNSTFLPLKNCLIHKHFEDQVKISPDAIALVCNHQQLTYRELNIFSNQLAHYLIRLGIKNENIIAIHMERGYRMVVVMLAVLKAGAAFLPIDSEIPKGRIGYMLNDSKASLIITDKSTYQNIIELMRVNQLNINLVNLDIDLSNICSEKKDNPNIQLIPHNLAYTIYTSGSTGYPKGVLIEHLSVVNCINSIQNLLNINSSDNFLAVTSISFDVAILDYFLPLSYGSKVVITDDITRKDFSVLADILNSEQITAMQATPSAWNEILSNGWNNKYLQTLKILTAGEALSENLANDLLSRGKLFNIYGPTEATIYATFSHIENSKLITIGKPIFNSSAYVLNQDLQPVPFNVQGELYIGGVGLARGYTNMSEKTAEIFIPNPFSNEPGSRLYKTGDIVKLAPSGNIIYIGRKDNQIKLRGYRIELSEIENIIMQYPLILNAVVLIRKFENDDIRLIAYIISSTKINISEIKSFLGLHLPTYMQPSMIIGLQSFPMTSTGKIDRIALDKLPLEITEDISIINPRTPIEEKLSAIWRELLKINVININKSFFDLGGHSLLATRLISKIKDVFNINIPLITIFKGLTIESLASIIEKSVNTYSCIIPVNTENSNLTTLFVHAMDGDVICYRELSNMLNTNAYALKSPILMGMKSSTMSIPELAKYFVTEIINKHIKSPLVIFGWSFGGVLAFEIARQIKLFSPQYENIKCVLLDSNADICTGPQLTKLQQVIAFGEYISILAKAKINLTMLNEDKALQQLKIIIKECLGVEYLTNNFNLLFNSFVNNLNALSTYHPQFYDDILYVIKPREGHSSQSSDKTLGWKKYAKEIQFYQIDGDHYTCLTDPYLKRIVEIINNITQYDSCNVKEKI